MARLTFLEVMFGQRQGAPPLGVKEDLSGKTVVVVGANGGIGLEAAKHFARMNPKRLILTARSVEKGKVAVSEIAKATEFKNVEPWQLDLGQFSSVIDFVDRFEKDGGRLDILVCNAAIAMMEYETFGGWESTIHVNYFATALLSILLLPRMEKTAVEHATKSRLVVVASEVHYWTSIQDDVLASSRILETLSCREYCTPAVMKDRYRLSKLLDVLFVRALAAHLPPTSNVIVTSVNPGFCVSGLRRHANLAQSAIFWTMERLFAWTSEEGSRQLIWAALGPPAEAGKERDEAVAQGAYVSHNGVREVSDFVLSEKGQESERRLWNETIDILSKASPQVAEISSRYLHH